MPLRIKFPTIVALSLILAGCSGGQKAADGSKFEANVGEAALSAGTPDVTLRLADEVLARDPEAADALTRRGLALTELGRLDEARISLRKALARHPHDMRTLLALGRVELPVDPVQAEADFQSVLILDGHNAAALNNLGIARDLQGHHSEAETAYRAALAAKPDMTAAQVNLGLCLAMLGQGHEAIGLLRPLADDPGATRKVREDYAAVLAMAGERQQAEQILAGTMAAGDVAPALDMLASMRVADGTKR
jgi:Flp pilus assembly protein TadD